MADDQVVKRGVVGIIILAIFVLAFLVLKPIMVAIIFGLISAYVFEPVYKKIKKMTGRKNLSAFLLIFGISILILVPLIYFVPALAIQSYDTYRMLRSFDFTQIFERFFNAEISATIGNTINNGIVELFAYIRLTFTDLLTNLHIIFFQFAVYLFTFFFATRDFEEMKKYLSDLSPFSTSTDQKFMKEFRGITNAIVFGQVFIGIIQGLALGVGLFFMGVGNVFVLTILACILSIIPVLGSWLIWLPVGVFLLIQGEGFAGLFILIYGAVFVSSLDNILRPYILSRQSNLPIALSVIGTIGGLFFFGIAGLVLGPLILAYVLIIVEFYKEGKLNELFKK